MSNNSKTSFFSNSSEQSEEPIIIRPNNIEELGEWLKFEETDNKITILGVRYRAGAHLLPDNFIIPAFVDGKQVYLPDDCFRLFYDTFTINLDLSEIRDVSNVKNMASMFENCGILETVNLSGLQFTRCYSMSCLFAGCSKLEKVDLSNACAKNVDNTSYMFYNCKSLAEIEQTNFIEPLYPKDACMYDGCNPKVIPSYYKNFTK